MRHERKSLSVSDVCRIITVCKKLNVNEIMFNDMHVIFDTAVTSKFNRKTGTKEMNNSYKDDMEWSEAESKQMQLDEMLITDPAGYEKLLMQGDLKNGTDEYSEA